MDIVARYDDIMAVLIHHFKGSGIVIEVWTCTAGGVNVITNLYMNHWSLDRLINAVTLTVASSMKSNVLVWLCLCGWIYSAMTAHSLYAYNNLLIFLIGIRYNCDTITVQVYLSRLIRLE